MEVSKYTVTVDLAKKHIEYGDYSIDVYKADSIKLCRHVEELQDKVNELTVPNVSKRYYWLKSDGTISNMWDEQTHKETIDDEMMEIAEQQGGATDTD